MRVVLIQNQIVELISHGHSDAIGLCPSLSTLQYTFWYSVKSFSGVVCHLSVADGIFHFTFSKSNQEYNSFYENLCSFFLVGMQVLQKEFSTRAKGELSVSVIKN